MPRRPSRSGRAAKDPPTGIVIRRATRADMPIVGRLGAELIQVHHAFDPQRFMAPRGDAAGGYAWFLGSELDNAQAVVLVAEREGDLLGYAYAGLEPQSWKELRDPAGFIHDVVVVEDARQQGVATLLVEAASRWLEEAGAPRVLLWTAERNAPAQRLFARLGFRRTMIEMTREAGERSAPARPGRVRRPRN
ncbi:MAG TPA: GNAT family N-acetyltransferase [Polyangia bacterium]